MGIKGKLGAVAAAVVVGVVPILAVASPASASTTCTVRKLGGNVLGMGDGYFFSCNGTTPLTIHVQITCAGVSGNQTVGDSSKEIGHPWAFGDPLYCSNVSFADTPKWWTS